MAVGCYKKTCCVTSFLGCSSCRKEEPCAIQMPEANLVRLPPPPLSFPGANNRLSPPCLDCPRSAVALFTRCCPHEK